MGDVEWPKIVAGNTGGGSMIVINTRGTLIILFTTLFAYSFLYSKKEHDVSILTLICILFIAFLCSCGSVAGTVLNVFLPSVLGLRL